VSSENKLSQLDLILLLVLFLFNAYVSYSFPFVICVCILCCFCCRLFSCWLSTLNNKIEWTEVLLLLFLFFGVESSLFVSHLLVSLLCRCTLLVYLYVHVCVCAGTIIGPGLVILHVSKSNWFGLFVCPGTNNLNHILYCNNYSFNLAVTRYAFF
jgi:hypothetical protein